MVIAGYIARFLLILQIKCVIFKIKDIMTDNTNNANPVQEYGDSESAARRPERHHRRPAPQNDKYFKIRNTLNIIFILGAIVGMAIFYFKNTTMGTIIIITAMAFKLAECCFRFLRQ